MGFLGEDKKIVPVLKTTDYNAGVDADSINMKDFHDYCFIITFGAITGDAVLTVNSGATEGSKTSALTFNYALGGAAIGTAASGSTVSCDVLAASASAASLTLTAATYQNKMLVIWGNAASMDVANGEEWLTLAISDAADAGIAHGVAILTPRYANNRSATCLK